MRKNLTLTLIYLLPILVMGQDNGIDLVKLEKEVVTYKKLFSYADSLAIRGNIGQVSESAINIAKTLDRQRPVDCFQKAIEMFDKREYNDASFLYSLGDLRYRYYNSSNPKYSKSNDGALLASFNYVLGEPIGYYLRSNADNYIGILKKCSDYLLSNDYVFFPKKKNPSKYLEQADRLNRLIADLETNKKTYQETWDKQRLDYDKNLDSFLEQMKKK
jgi:hypothetical protein